MTIKEAIEIYEKQENLVNLSEGLKFFKLSKKISKAINKVGRRAEKYKYSDKETNYNPIKKILYDLTKLNTKVVTIEDSFAAKKMDRKSAKQAISILIPELKKIVLYAKNNLNINILNKTKLAWILGIATAGIIGLVTTGVLSGELLGGATAPGAIPPTREISPGFKPQQGRPMMPFAPKPNQNIVQKTLDGFVGGLTKADAMLDAPRASIDKRIPQFLKDFNSNIQGTVDTAKGAVAGVVAKASDDTQREELIKRIARTRR